MEDSTLADITKTSLLIDPVVKKLNSEESAKLTEWTKTLDEISTTVTTLKSTVTSTSSASDHESLYNLIPQLLLMEKRTRVSSFDASALCKRTALLIISIPIHLKAWTKLGEFISTLCKRRNVLKKVVQAVVRTSMMELEGDELNATQRESLIETLRDVSKGKIYVELEFARLTFQLSCIEERKASSIGQANEKTKEESHKHLKKAADLMEDVTVETIGTMSKSEKVKLTLHHARILLLLGDYIKGGIVAKKVKRHRLRSEASTKEDIEMQLLKLTHCRLMIEVHTDSHDNLELAQDFWDVYETPLVLKHATANQSEEKSMDVEDTPTLSIDAWRAALIRVVLFTVCAEPSLQRSDMLNRLKNCAPLQTKDSLATFKKLVDIHLTENVFVWDSMFTSQEFQEISSHSIFNGKLLPAPPAGSLQKLLSSSDTASKLDSTFVRPTPVDGEVRITNDDKETGLMGTGASAECCAEWARLFRIRIAEHNVQVVSKRYGMITSARLSQMLCLSLEDTEFVVCTMVSDKKRKENIYARVDRPNGIVSFLKPKGTDDVLQAWSGKLEEMLKLVDASCFLIEKEETLQKILKKQAKKEKKKKKKKMKQKEKMEVETKA